MSTPDAEMERLRRPGLRVVAPDGALVNVVGIDVADGHVVRLHSILNPDKLAHLGPLSALALRKRPADA